MILKRVCTKINTFYQLNWNEGQKQLKTVVTDDISRYQADSVIPLPQRVWKEKMNIKMAARVFLINLSLHSSSADIGLGF